MTANDIYGDAEVTVFIKLLTRELVWGGIVGLLLAWPLSNYWLCQQPSRTVSSLSANGYAMYFQPAQMPTWQITLNNDSQFRGHWQRTVYVLDEYQLYAYQQNDGQVVLVESHSIAPKARYLGEVIATNTLLQALARRQLKLPAELTAHLSAISFREHRSWLGQWLYSAYALPIYGVQQLTPLSASLLTDITATEQNNEH
ncbi:hypothetical protein JYB87_11550 [Shewanella avicenniae]|uniref:Uncharacterized protein n=1 Tax=Shewanella avicenniae TaxID=2814294 RepID=A0ABX7QLR7_9GAMM|nr:hypothetical protein [Shewanella avicenniae]QSX32401.1 hypothetical protein JYB87_11550 [Shewanella avicenniae]